MGRDFSLGHVVFPTWKDSMCVSGLEAEERIGRTREKEEIWVWKDRLPMFLSHSRNRHVFPIAKALLLFM